jgi:predicted MFS family arabinose efflux permease
VTATAKFLGGKDRRWQMLALLFVAFALCYVDRQAAFSIFPVLKKELGFSDTQLGLVGSLFSWSYALFMPISGRIADVTRRDWLVIASLALWSLATLGTALSNSPTSFLIWRVVMGLTESLYFPAALGILAVLHPGSTRSRALGIHQAAQFAGIIAGGWYGGWAAETIGWRMGFAALCITGIVYSVVLTRVFQGVVPSIPVPLPARQGPGSLFRVPLFLALAFSFFWFCAMLWIVYAWLPDLLYERFRLSLSSSGLNATLYIQVSCGVGVLIGGWLADRLALRIRSARLYVVGCGMLLSAPFAYLAFGAVTLARFRLYAVAFGLLAGFAIANIFAAAYDVIRNQNCGFATGLLNMTGGLSGGAAMLMAGVYKNEFGIINLMAWTAAATVLSGVLLCVGARWFIQPGLADVLSSRRVE